MSLATARSNSRGLPFGLVKAVSFLLAAATAATLAGTAVAGQVEGKSKRFDIENVNPAMQTGTLTNATAQGREAFVQHLRYDGASWLRLTFSDVQLGDGDFIRIVSLENGMEQNLSNADPQYSDPSFEGKMYSARFAGGNLDVSLHLAPGSTGAHFTLRHILVARGLPPTIESVCGPTDDRALLNDPCLVRIVDSAGGWGSGFMIGPNCMLSCNHVMTNPPWTIERNVPASNAGTGALTPAAAADQFPVANLNNSTVSGTNNAGNDWAVVTVPNNAQGAPGAGCNPTFNCTFTNNCNPPGNLTVSGFGTDSRNARNGVLQTDSGACVAGGANATDFQYRADTTPNGSGSRVTDANGAIVGIHQRGGCTGGNPETGANGGTTLNAPGLRAAIQARCGIDICPTVAISNQSWGQVKILYR